MGAERDFSPSFSAGSRRWVLRISLLRQQTPHNCSNRCVSLKYFLKPFAQKIIKEDRIAHGYRAVFDSTRTCLVPWESTSPPSHRQGGNYHIETVKWLRRNQKTEGFLCRTYGVKPQMSTEEATQSILNHIWYWETHGKQNEHHLTATPSGNSEAI